MPERPLPLQEQQRRPPAGTELLGSPGEELQLKGSAVLLLLSSLYWRLMWQLVHVETQRALCLFCRMASLPCTWQPRRITWRWCASSWRTAPARASPLRCLPFAVSSPSFFPSVIISTSRLVRHTSCTSPLPWRSTNGLCAGSDLERLITEVLPHLHG